MKILPILLVLMCISGYSQEVIKDSVSGEVSADTTIMVAVQSPRYPGGVKALSEFLEENIKYSPDAIEKKIEGTVILSFIVDQTGNVSNIKIIKGLDPDLDQASIDAVKKMPVWIPGQINGKPSKQEFSLPVKFTLPRKLRK